MLCSVTIVVAYLMKEYGMSLSQALEHVKRKRPVAAPNFGFTLQLQEFERSLKGKSLLLCLKLFVYHVHLGAAILTL